MRSCSRLTGAPLVVGPVTQALKVEKALPEEVERLMLTKKKILTIDVLTSDLMQA